jgi:hypothetical protein
MLRQTSRAFRHRTALLVSALAALAFAASGALPAAHAQGAAPAESPVPLSLPAAEGAELDPDVPSPDEYLGYPLGSRFTHHDRIVGYLEALAAATDRVRLEPYGETYEGRPLVLAVIGAPEHLERLDALRERHLELASGTLIGSGLDRALDDQPVVLWLGYGVHGNESSSSEAALATAYLLAARLDAEAAGWRRDAVVLLDPLSNPDGRERYVSGYEQRQGAVPDPDPRAAEHWEPWPGGRQNHYLFDLNRDWAWLTQRETRDRIAVYRRWEPQVHVDLHEMDRRSSYFFPPSADPIHPLIPSSVLRWLGVFGRGNAAAFDERGYLFYKEENFDLFYPGYGDSYPALRGAVGMTYEMAGGGRAGLAVRLPGGDVLTLADRAERHVTASLATVATAAAHRRALLSDFAAARSESARTDGAYLWPADQPEAVALAELLRDHGVTVETLGASTTLTARRIGPAEGRGERSFPRGAFVVRRGQPLGGLAESLLELEAEIPERFIRRQRERLDDGLRAQFYDITGWSLPLAYGLDVWETRAVPVGFGSGLRPWREGGPAVGVDGSGDLGVVLPPQGLAGYRAAVRLLADGHRVSRALEPFEQAGERFPAGTLFVPRGRGEGADGFFDEVAAVAGDTGVRLRRVATSYSDEGISLGSEQMQTVLPPRVALVGGEGVSPTGFGALWHLFDRQVGLPVSRLEADRLGRSRLSDVDVLILPDGRYELDEQTAGHLTRWVEAGGTLIAVEGAVQALAEAELTTVKERGPGMPGEETGDEEIEEETPTAEVPYTPGAVVRTDGRLRHPLLAGYDDTPAVLVTGSTFLDPTGQASQDVLWVTDQTAPVISGFAWPEAEEPLMGSLLVAEEERGDGRVIVFAQDPVFRGFWRGTAPLLLNAALFGAGDGGEY